MKFDILIVDPQPSQGLAIARSICDQGFRTRTVNGPAELLKAVSQQFASQSGVSQMEEKVFFVSDDESNIEETIATLRLNGRNFAVAAYTTSYLDSRKIFNAYTQGVFDYFFLPSDRSTITTRLREAKQFFDPACSDAERIRCAFEKVTRLSIRESEILELSAAGMTSKEAAKVLGISHRTVEIHRQSTLCKLGVKNMYEAVAMCTLSKIACKVFFQRKLN